MFPAPGICGTYVSFTPLHDTPCCLHCSDTYINFTLALAKSVGVDDGYDADVYDLVRPTLWGMGVAVEWGQG